MESKLLIVATILLVLASSLNAAHLARNSANTPRTNGEYRNIAKLAERGGLNADCQSAEPITLGGEAISVDTKDSVFFLLESPRVLDAVSFQSIATPNGAGLWYKFVGTGESVEITTCDGASTSSKITINVFKASETDCSDIDSAVAGTSYQSEGVCTGGNPTVSFCTEKDATYKVFVAGDRLGETFTIAAKEAGDCVAPKNSDVEDAVEITLSAKGNAVVSGNNYGAPIQHVPCCNTQGLCYNGVAGVAATWYKITGSGTGVNIAVEVNAESAIDTAISVYTQDKKGELSCQVGEDDAVYNFVFQPDVTFYAAKDEEYLVAVFTYEGSAGGDFKLNITSEAVPVNQAPEIGGLSLEKITTDNQIVISYDLADDDNTNGVHLYVQVASEWVLVTSGLSGDIGSDVAVDGSRKTFLWHGALSGEYYILLKANDEEYQSASEPLFIHVSWNEEEGEVYEAECSDNYPYIPYPKVITWVNHRGEVVLEDGRHVEKAPQPIECVV